MIFCSICKYFPQVVQGFVPEGVPVMGFRDGVPGEGSVRGPGGEGPGGGFQEAFFLEFSVGGSVRWFR